MNGVLLTGGLASRLGPITKVTNKHLLPIYDKPMIFYGIELLRDLGCERIIIVLGGNSVGDIVNLVKDGSQFGVEIVYKYQSEPKGISHAIGLTKDLIPYQENFLVLLGDNLFSNTFSLQRSLGWWNKEHHVIFLHSSENPHAYGQPLFYNEGMNISKFVEKDSTVDHNLIVTGLYAFNWEVFQAIENQTPSERGEYEITDTLTLELPFVDSYGYDGFWSDCGTPEGLVEASKFMRDRNGNTENS